jgi:hypothetical protein
MALYYELPIYKETYSLLLTLFKLTRNFNREYKYTIGQSMKNTGMEMVQHIFKANSTKDKANVLSDLSDCFEILKLQLRLCMDMRLISIQQHADVWKTIDSIGKQLTGWKKAGTQNSAGIR